MYWWLRDPGEEAETPDRCWVTVDTVDMVNLAWEEQAEVGWEGGQGREEAAKVVEQAC